MNKYNESKLGFTLVEVLAVIAILGLIFAIVYPLMDNILNNNSKKLYDDQIKSLERLTEEYFYSKMENYDLSKDFTVCVTIDELYNNGLLTNPTVKNPIDNTTLTGKIKVNYKLNTKTTYTYSDTCD